MTKLLYIAGYGRSGSTILDIILGNHPEILGLGEVGLLHHEWVSDTFICSCGARYRDCEFWKDVFVDPELAVEAGPIIRKLENVSFLPRLLLGLVSEHERRIYRAYHEQLFRYVAARSQKAIVVDSSKSAFAMAGRLLALRTIAGQDIYVIHLVRNGLSIMEALVLTGGNRALQGYMPPPRWAGLRAVLSWVSANLVATMLGRRMGLQRYLLLRYEDFLADPATALRRIGRLCGFDPEIIVERIHRGEAFEMGHRVAGNRIRLQKTITLVRPDVPRFGERLKPYHRLFFAVAGGWLNRFHGYK